jgi:tetratricopeptide (TPR) repeat protein
MATSPRLALLLALVPVLTISPLRAEPGGEEKPAPFKPLHKTTAEENNHREAQKLFALGLLRQRQDRLVEAQHLLEQASKLEPDTAPIYKALVPLYLALGRGEEAMLACRKTLDLDPDDHDTWYLYGRQLRDDGRFKEAIEALTKGSACSNVGEHLDLLVQMQFDLGTLHEEAKDWAKAEQAYDKVARIFTDKRSQLLEVGPFSAEQLNEEAAKNYERLGHVCTEAGHYERAVTAYVKAQKSDPERAGRLGYNLAQVYIAQNRPDKALAPLDSYLKTQPQGIEAYELKVDLLKRLNRERDILPALESHAARDRHNAPLQLLLAKQYAQAKLGDKAEEVYLRQAHEAPTPEVYRGLFLVYKDQGDLGKALTLLDLDMKAAAPAEDEGAQDSGAAARARAMLQVLREGPDLVDAILDTAVAELRLGGPGKDRRSRVTLRFLGILAARAKKLDKAEALFTRCLQQVTPRTEAEVYGGLLEVLYQEHKYKEVIKVAKGGLDQAQATNRVMFHRMLALSYSQIDNKDEAVKQADAAVRLAGEDDKLRLELFRAEILREVELYDKAVSACKDLFETYGKPSEVRDIRRSLSIIYSSANEHAKSEEQLRLILEADPTDATAHNDLGYIMADHGKNLDEAEKLIRRAITLDQEERKAGGNVDDGDNAAYLDSLGWVLFRKGDTDEAKTWLEKAVALPGGADDPVVWDHLGDVYYRLENTAKAREAWEKSVQMYEIERRRKPDDRFKEVKQKLRTLEQEAKPR